MKKFVFYCLLISQSYPQIEYNHPEFNWHTFETEHFHIHYHDETEMTAREASTVAEIIYPHITSFYDYEPKTKTHLVLTDPDDYSNGAAYYYDNKIVIWASPLDFELRGSHRWLQNVIAHEFAHIVSLQKSMKAGTKIPGAYIQLMNYEEEKRPDVLYGYPNTLISYPIPGTNVPPWLAEGIAQFMYDDADWDNWDSHRDMILRDRTVNDNLLTFTEMNTFGKKGIGNESTYNAGYALSTYIANEYGSEHLSSLMNELSSPFQFSVNNAIEAVLGVSGEEVYQKFKSSIEEKYSSMTEVIGAFPSKVKFLQNNGTTNIYPKWNPNQDSYVYLSNKNNDYFSQTDLYYHSFDAKEDTKIKSGVFSPPTWHENGKIIYYSKRSKFPNKNGSRFYDIYSYNLDTEEEKRLTVDARAYNPVYIARDSTIAYLATYDGGQDIYLFDLELRESRKITDFTDRPMISFLTYDNLRNKLYFDYTKHHFRDIYSYDFAKKKIEAILEEESFDERNIAIGEAGIQVYSQDRSGIFNLYMINDFDSTRGYITNVMGGAFMPDISPNGKILFSLYDQGAYRIALLEEVNYIANDYVGYGENYHLANAEMKPPIISLNNAEDKSYEDQFPNMFILPKLMWDYGTLKPGFYFSSNEIINRLALFGGASINKLNDVDMFFILDFKRLYPTIFFETYYLTRNTSDKSLYKGVYPINDDIKFRLVQFRSGLKIPLYGTPLEVAIARQWYRAFIQEEVSTNDPMNSTLKAGAAYDYFRGWSLSTSWSLDMRKRAIDKSINPSSGFTFSANIDIEKNDFINGLNLSDSGTLLEDFTSNNLTRIQLGGSFHYEIPKLERFTLSLKGNVGYITRQDVDDFFYFYLGGIPGLKGYPFYSIKGANSGFIDLTLRFPIIKEKHYKIGWIIFQNSTFGAIFQAGDAWVNKGDLALKRSYGLQWRLNGFSFYNFPTAIELEYHQPMDKFEIVIYQDTDQETKIQYGDKGRAYVKILFDF